MERGHYNGYRGKLTAWDVLRRVLVLLAVMLLLVVAGLIVGQQYIVYTDDGVRLDLPWAQPEAAPPAADTPISLDIVQKPAPSVSAPAESDIIEITE